MFKSKIHISLLLLVIFASVKLVGLHKFIHSEDSHIEDCELCNFTITSNEILSLASRQALSLQATIYHYQKKELNFDYSYQFIQNFVSTTLFSRPPPTV